MDMRAVLNRTINDVGLPASRQIILGLQNNATRVISPSRDPIASPTGNNDRPCPTPTFPVIELRSALVVLPHPTPRRLSPRRTQNRKSCRPADTAASLVPVVLATLTDASPHRSPRPLGLAKLPAYPHRLQPAPPLRLHVLDAAR